MPKKPPRRGEEFTTYPRDVLPYEIFQSNRAEYAQMADQAQYACSSKHKTVQEMAKCKRTVAQNYKTAKGTRCHDGGVTDPDTALRLLQEGLRNGLVSKEESNEPGWPKYVWAVRNGKYFEASHSDVGGLYHGHPIADGRDPMHDAIRDRWPQSQPLPQE